VTGSTLAARVRAGQLTVGTFVSSASTAIGDVVGRGGLDWMVVDGEHGVPDLAAAAAIARSARATTPVLARTPSRDPHRVEVMLDAGAVGVVIPRVDSAAEAEAELAATQYARSRGLARAVPAFGWGAMADRDPLEVDADVLRVVQIETAAALDAVEEIAALPAVDVLFLGPGDLALDLRRTGRHETTLEAAAERIASASRSASKAAGTLVGSPGDLAPWVEKGYSFLACSADVRFVAEGVERIAAEADRIRVSP
jgi:2-keto-3-deoxy-L-rhamnonate aldolase RhmA